MGHKTIKERIADFANGKYYFHITDLRKYFVNKRYKFRESSLKQNIYLLKKEGLIYEAGRGWYSTIREKFDLDIRPIEGIKSLIKKKFPFLEFSCWSTEQLKSYFHHLPNHFVTFIYTHKDFLQSLKDFLTENDYKVFLNPGKKEIGKYVEFNNRPFILRPAISYRKPMDKFFTSIEKILVDLFMETQKTHMMDMVEYKKVISNIVLNYRINMATILDYAYNRKIRQKLRNIVGCDKLTKTTFR